MKQQGKTHFISVRREDNKPGQQAIKATRADWNKVVYSIYVIA